MAKNSTDPKVPTAARARPARKTTAAALTAEARAAARSPTGKARRAQAVNRPVAAGDTAPFPAPDFFLVARTFFITALA